MTEEEIERMSALLDERTIKLMERESELADRLEEIDAQKEELTAAIEELVLKNAELIQRNKELDELLYRSSHDLKTPVSSLQGMVNLLGKIPLPEEARVYLSHIRSLTEQMHRVLASLSRMSRAILDPIQIKEIEIASLTDKVLDSLKALPKYADVEIQISLEGKPQIKADPDLLTILLIELVSNAITFRNKSSGYVKIKWSIADSITLEVVDDGEGIQSNIGERIFGMFYRGSLNSIGSGMGLYIADKLATRLGGKIKWLSNEGLTIFTVRIPFNS